MSREALCRFCWLDHTAHYAVTINSEDVPVCGVHANALENGSWDGEEYEVRLLGEVTLSTEQAKVALEVVEYAIGEGVNGRHSPDLEQLGDLRKALKDISG